MYKTVFFILFCLFLTTQTQIFAHKTVGNIQLPELTCSEINYNSHPSKASGNWLELHNFGTTAINIGGYRLQEEGSAAFFTLPVNTTIPGGGYLVLSDNLAQFQGVFPAVSNVIGSTGIALGNNGDTILLLDGTGAQILRIGYLDNLPWPQCADGAGRTLENTSLTNNTNLIDPSIWRDGCMGGSPGAAFSPCTEPIFFNEINYNSSAFAEAGDWVEIWNRSGQDLNMGGWQLRDGNDTLRFTFPNTTQLKKDSFLVVYSDLFLFNDVHPGAAPNKVGPFQFGLSGNGEIVRLFDQNEDLVLSMFYNDALPWPGAPDGEGPTLELRAAFTDLNTPANWAASCGYGTPGRQNSPCSSATGEPAWTPEISVAPNPNMGAFRVNVAETQVIQWQLTDINGRVLQHGYPADGQYQWDMDASHLPAGIYCLNLSGTGWFLTKKVVLYSY